MLDLVSLGESMLRFSPPPGSCLEACPELRVFLAGAESNVAIAASRLGWRTGWVSKLPANALGRKTASLVRQHGVDVSRVIWSRDGRMGLYFVDLGVPPRNADVVYDRVGSAFAGISPDEVDWDYLTKARVVHLTGITPALGPGCRQVVEQALGRSREAGVLTSFDVNYRSRLWTADRARDALGPLLSCVDVLFVSEEDAREVLGAEGRPEDVARSLRVRFGNRVVVLTLGAEGALACDEESCQHRPAVPGGLVDAVGRGDAFVAGFLCGYLGDIPTDGETALARNQSGDLGRGLAWGNAMASLKQTYAGDITWVTLADVEQVTGGRQGELRR